MQTFDDRLEAVLAKKVEGFRLLRSAERLSRGASKEIYRIVADTDHGGETFALRRGAGARHLGSEIGLDTEAQLMVSARAAGVPGPAVVHVLTEEDGLGEGFIMEWLEGETIGSRINRIRQLDAVRPRLASQCGEILARIHGLDVDMSGLAELEPIDPPTLIRRTWDEYHELDFSQPMIDYTGRWLLDNLPPPTDRRLVHGDFRNGNFIVDPDEGIVAVLDWELAHVGDPLRDLGWLCTGSWHFGRPDLPVGGFGDIADLIAGYEATSGRSVDPEHLRFWRVFGSFWWSVGCLRMAATHRDGTDSSVERPAIGRRSSECQIDCANLLIPGPAAATTDVPDEPTEPGLPRLDELLASVADHLRVTDVGGTGDERSRFLARVAANSLDVVQRDLRLGPVARAAEHERLRELLGSDDDLAELRRRLGDGIHDGTISFDRPGLEFHLRSTLVDQVGIDQPDYPGLATALA